MNLYRQKLLNAILYFVKSRSKPTTITALAKLLFAFDSEHFKQTGVPAIGLRYYAYPKGPLPLDFWGEVKDGTVPEDFKKFLRITVTEDELNPKITTKQFHALAKPDLTVFSPRQKRILENLTFIYKDALARDMIEASHEPGSPWEKTVRTKGERGEISYMDSLGADSPMTVEEAQSSYDEFLGALETFHLKPTN